MKSSEDGNRAALEKLWRPKCNTHQTMDNVEHNTGIIRMELSDVTTVLSYSSWTTHNLTQQNTCVPKVCDSPVNKGHETDGLNTSVSPNGFPNV
jgi:hypothetical protein